MLADENNAHKLHQHCCIPAFVQRTTVTDGWPPTFTHSRYYNKCMILTTGFIQIRTVGY